MRKCLALIAFVLLAPSGSSYAQPGTEFEIRIPPRPLDSVDRTLPSLDSARIFDSIFAVRRAEANARMSQQRYVKHQDFFSLKVGSTAFSRIRAGELQRYFGERFDRPDLDAEESNLTGLDRLVWLAGEVQFSTTWGIFAEYSYTGRWYGTDVTVGDSTDVTRVPLGHGALELTSHAFVVGPFVIPFETPFFRTKLFAGIGPSTTSIFESDQSNTEREGTASGLALTFEAEFDFRIIQQLSFGLSLFTRQQSTGTIAVKGGGDLSDPFGTRTWKTTTNPNSSFINGGLGISLHYYF
jgi:hypothetical protein